jgi:hypothetical protein
MSDTFDYRREAKTSDGAGCFWLVEYRVQPLIASTGSADKDADLHKRTVNVLSATQPTVGQAYTVIPNDEKDRVTSVSVREMHVDLLGREFARGANFVDLYNGHVGPLKIEVRKDVGLRDRLPAAS